MLVLRICRDVKAQAAQTLFVIYIRDSIALVYFSLHCLMLF